MFYQKGQSLIEVLIVLAVTVIIVVALTMAIMMSLKNAQFAQNQLRATKYGQDALEKIRAIRDRNEYGEVYFRRNDNNQEIRKFSGLWGVNMSQQTDCNPSCYFKFEGLVLTSVSESESKDALEGAEGNLTRQITLSDEPNKYATEKKITVAVRWTDAAGGHKSDLQTIITPLGCQGSGDYCNSYNDCCSKICLNSGLCQ